MVSSAPVAGPLESAVTAAATASASHDAVVSKEKENGSFALFASGVAKCMAGLMLLMQSRTAEGTDMSEKAQLNDMWVKLWTMMMDFVMQILVIGLAFGLGYLVGTLRNGTTAAAPTTAAAAAPPAVGILRPESEGTQTVGFVTVQANELTHDALKERLRQMQALVSGPKEDLVTRYLRHLEGRQLVLTRPP
jgi:hypothetical protein